MKRFAIQFPNGHFSSGAECRPVEFEEAKLWRYKHHVTAHLARWSDDPYPLGTQVVEVEVSAVVTPLYLVGVHMAKKKKAAALERARKEAFWAERGVEQAKKMLKSAQDKLGRTKK